MVLSTTSANPFPLVSSPFIDVFVKVKSVVSSVVAPASLASEQPSPSLSKSKYGGILSPSILPSKQISVCNVNPSKPKLATASCVIVKEKLLASKNC